MYKDEGKEDHWPSCTAFVQAAVAQVTAIHVHILESFSISHTDGKVVMPRLVVDGMICWLRQLNPKLYPTTHACYRESKQQTAVYTKLFI